MVCNPEWNMENLEAMSERLRRAVSLSIISGYQLDKHAFDFLSTISQTEDPVKLVEEAIRRVKSTPQKTLFIQRNLLEEIIKEASPERGGEELIQPESSSSILGAKREKHHSASDIDAEIEIIQDPTEEICETGSVEEYLEYFQDRFRRTRKLLRKRIDAKDAISISEALKSSTNSKVKVIGMITEKREHEQRIFLTIEDLETNTTVLVSPRINKEVVKKARMLLLDQVVCIDAIKGKGDLLIAKSILWPDIPQRRPNSASVQVCAALISDLHIGSKTFMRKEFSRFLLWLNGKLGDKNSKDTANNVKYLVIAGDLVDGVGVYPGQLKELEIADIYEQYSLASKFFEQIPDSIELILIPGNHDASRKALPQPALSKAYAEPLCEARRVYLLGNPSTIKLHNVELLLYHGRSLDDVVASTPNISFQMPDKAMKLLLQSRHLAPIYGERTPIAPENKDYLIIDRPPDIFHSGHVHVTKIDTYRGTLIINSGAWQKRTDFQKKMGLIPNPGIIPIVNLQTLQTAQLDFTGHWN
ncbi:MAG: DNA-directed DNA polymerase II small subunit [Candidatus Bathyarchaeota archaeon]|nr:MAG: DNA-directed DNA polymerase II small subunit [Candidatus Bathyarchaeota archaeon]